MKRKTIKTAMAVLLLALLGMSGMANAQRQRVGHYLYRSTLHEVAINEGAVLVYFRTAAMPREEVRLRYRCLREVRLPADKADTLFATTVAVEGDYDKAVARLKARDEVWDVEPVVGSGEGKKKKM